MDFSIIISIITIITGISSVILSITNFISTKKEMNIKIKMTNDDIEIDKLKSEYLSKISKLSLVEECQYIIDYFKEISANNIYKVIISKKMNDKFIIIATSLLNDKDEKVLYSIEENINFLTTNKNKNPYYINNIPYFNKHENKYINLNFDDNKYQSIIICPIQDENDTIIGSLSIYIEKPLNELINKDNITKFLVKECKMIASNKEFIKYSI